MISIDKAASKALFNMPRYLRILVDGGGCSGFRVVYEHAKEYDTQDLVINDKLIVDKQSLILLDGCTLTYADTLVYTGFSMQFASNMHSCGCGESFTIGDTVVGS